MKINLKLWRSRSIVLTVLSLFLGSFFMLMGSLKLTSWINREIHRELRRNFIRFAKIIPIIRTHLGIKVPASMYRMVWGISELSMGFILVFLPLRRAKIMANAILLAMTILSIYNHYRAGYKFDRIAPCIVFTLMLTCRLIVEYQVHRRELFGFKRSIISEKQRN